MSADTLDQTVLRFDVVVRGASYRALVDGLRSADPSSKSRTAPRQSIRAEIELDLESKQYSLTTLGRHKLPKGLLVQPGSRTHTNLTNYLSTHLSGDTAKTLSSLLQEISDVAPIIPTGALKLFREDLQLQSTNHAPAREASERKVFVVDEISTEISLDIDDLPTLVAPTVELSHLEQAAHTLAISITVEERLVATAVGNLVEVSGSLRIPAELAEQTDVFLHWGSYEESSPAWQDELVTLRADRSGSHYRFFHRLHVPTRGSYGVTLFAQIRGTTQPIWLGKPRLDDARVSIVSDDQELARERAEAFRQIESVAVRELSRAIAKHHKLFRRCEMIATDAPHLGLGALLARACTTTDSHRQIASLAQSLAEDTDPSALKSAILNYGIGEIVFATPEGPHAAAGGLAQVISGLCPELCRAGIPATIISPLYSRENGNRHTSAQHLIRHGIKIGAHRVRPSLLGTISVPLGPTYHSGTTHLRRQSATIPLKVYLAQHGSLRLFLLSNASVFDRLYQPVFSDEQLRRAVVLSRGALELISEPQFGIRPSAIVSNDWMTACLPTLLALDPRYQDVPWLKSSKTIHMIHNGGADYHGRLPIHHNDEDLWPLLGLAPEHFFGFRDPHHGALLNLTMAATKHTNGAVLTVSRPYAQELTTHRAGDGLESSLNEKRDRVFGISNGISRHEIDRFLSSRAGISGRSFSSLDEVLKGKQLVQSEIQRRFGLAVNSSARIISFVGRLAEQKGLALLSGLVSGTGHSVLEEILLRHPDAQILVAGPATDGDREARNLRECLDYLRNRYPGRIRAHLDYVAHAEALEIIFGSTFFFMPSRFEPGGITQLEALAAGTLVIGRRVGGIAATIDNYCPQTGAGNGFLCDDFEPAAFARTANWALSLTRESDVYKGLVQNALEAQHDWSNRVSLYRALFQRTILGDTACAELPWTGENLRLLERCR